MSTKKENQHFVPKFYLRHFSYKNNNRQIGVYNIGTNKFIEQAKLKTQAYRTFFYGNDGEVENLLSDLENIAAPIFKTILSWETLPHKNSDDYDALLTFIIITHLRNPIMPDIMDSLIGQIEKRANEVTESHIPNISLPKTSLENKIRNSLSMAAEHFISYKSLMMKLLITGKSCSFLTCDNPVVLYNQFFELHNVHGGWTGHKSKGLQIFFPLNPYLTVLIYDHNIYKVGDRKKDVILLDCQSVDNINKLQFLNCTNNIYFNDNINKEYIEKINNDVKNFVKPNIGESDLFAKIDNKRVKSENEFVVRVGASNMKAKLKLNFITLTKKAKRFKIVQPSDNLFR